MLRSIGKRLLKGTRFEASAQEFLCVKARVRIVNFLFQRVFRINAGAPWSVHYTSIVENPDRLRLGRGVSRSLAVSAGCYLQAYNGIEIGDDTIFAPGVKIVSTNHDEVTFGAVSESPIVIGSHCWLGANAVILPGVTIGDGSIVGAGAVVTKPVPPGVIVAGVPARVVRSVRPAAGGSAVPASAPAGCGLSGMPSRD